MSQLGAGALFVFFSRLITFALRFGSSVIVARALGASGKGQVALVILIPNLLALLANPGLGMASVYFLGRGSYSHALIVRNTLGLTLLIGVALCVMGILMPPQMVSWLLKGETESWLVTLGFISVPGLLLSANLSNVLVGLQRIRTYSAVIALESVAELVLNILTLLLLRLGVLGGVLSFVLRPYISALLLMLLLRPYWHSPGRWIDRNLTQASLGYGLRGHIGNVLQFLNYRLDYFLVHLLAGAGALGMYTIGVTMAELLLYLPGSVATVIFPRAAAASKAEIDKETPGVARQTIFLTAAAGVALLLFSYPTVMLAYGRGFLPAVGPLAILIPGIVALGWAKVLASDLAGRGLIHLNSVIALVALLLTVVMDLLLIPPLGIVGASLASSASYLVTAILTAVIYSRLSGNSLRSILLLRQADWQRYRAWMTKFGEALGLASRIRHQRAPNSTVGNESRGAQMTKKPYDQLYAQFDMEERPFGYSREYTLWREGQLKRSFIGYIASPGRLLDVGGGTGLLRHFLPDFVEERWYINLDPSTEMLRYCRSKVVAGEGERIPFPDESFDYVVCSEVLEHVNDKLQVLRECFRVLRRGGWFFLTTPRTGWRKSYRCSVFAPLELSDILYQRIRQFILQRYGKGTSRITMPKGVVDIPSNEQWLRRALEDEGFEVYTQFRADNHVPWANQGESRFWRWFADRFVDARRFGHCTVAICRKRKIT